MSTNKIRAGRALGAAFLLTCLSANVAMAATPSPTATSAPMSATSTATDATDELPGDAATAEPSATSEPEAPAQLTSGDQYMSLGVAMTQFYADSKGMALSDFVMSNPEQSASLLGVSMESLSELPTQDSASLTKGLSLKGAMLDTSGYANLSKAATDITAKSSTLDAAVVAAGAGYANQMAALRTPALPNAPKLDSSLATSMPKEGLAFGLFLDKSLTSLVTDSPDVFAQVQSTGLGTPEAQKAWKRSMNAAMSGSQKDMTSMLPSPCGGVFLTAMASGDAKAAGKSMPAGGNCGSCLVTGLYSHNQMAGIFNPNLNSTRTNTTPGVTNPSDWANLPAWQKGLISQQNNDLGSSLDKALGRSSASTAGTCDGGSKAVTSTAGTSLSKTLSFLNK